MSIDTKVLKLLNKEKKGLIRGFFRAIFSRVTIILILIILQALLLISGFVWLNQFQIHLHAIQSLVALLTVVYLVNCPMDSVSKLTWMLIILPFPVVGTTLFIYTRRDWGYNGIKRQHAIRIRETRAYLRQEEEVYQELKEEHSTTYNLVKYLRRGYGNFPVYKNSEVTYFPTGEDKFEALKEELRKAEKYIFMEYFIIDEGIMWGEILAILEEKVREGVEVRVMYDGMLEFSTLSFDYKDRLRKIGIKAKAFSGLTPFISTYYNYRDHRKIVVIDGKVAFTGGVNLADEYINQKERFGHWKDTALRVKGEAVDTFLILFLQTWGTSEARKVDNVEDYQVKEHIKYDNEGFVLPYGDSPLDNDKVGENVYVDIINHARDYVYIMTPYLILDSELEHALEFAALRGVDIRIVMPGIPDKKSAFALAKTYYPSLMEAGVKIYEYSPGFVHAKVFVADDIKAVVGTINLDYRSLYHHFECATYLYKSDAIAQIKEDVLDTIQKSDLVTDEKLKNEKLYYKIVGPIIKLVAPLM